MLEKIGDGKKRGVVFAHVLPNQTCHNHHARQGDI
jgi:hypothetical protein